MTESYTTAAAGRQAGRLTYPPPAA
jgi:hypothetical protein